MRNKYPAEHGIGPRVHLCGPQFGLARCAANNNRQRERRSPKLLVHARQRSAILHKSRLLKQNDALSRHPYELLACPFFEY